MTLAIALAVALAGAGAAFVTRILRASSLLDRPREWVVALVPWRRFDELVGCPWCLGFWVAGIFVAGDVAGGLLPARLLWLAWPAAALLPGRLG